MPTSPSSSGRAAALTSPVDRPQILIVRDTRESGEMLEAALAAGIAAGGGHALLGGVLPTPGASVLVRRYGFDMAAVVSASHNPYHDNGIKFFGPEGMKIGDDQEAEIERRLEEPSAQHRPPARAARRGRGLPARAPAALLVPRSERRARAARLRERGHPPRGTGDLPPPGRRCATRSRRSPTAATSTTESAPRTSRRWPSTWTATTWHSPSTATAIACWRWTGTGRSWTATS